MRKILVFASVLALVFSCAALADQQITSNRQADMTIIFEAQQYDYFVVSIPAQVQLDNTSTTNFTVSLDVDDRYNWSYSIINLDVAINDTYAEWYEGEGVWNRGYVMENNAGDRLHYWVISRESGNSLWPEELEGTQWSERRFDNPDLPVVEDMTMGYDPNIFSLSIGGDGDFEHHISRDIELRCFYDRANLPAGSYSGNLTFNIINCPMDEGRLLDEFDVIINYNDSDDPADWTYEPNNGRYTWNYDENHYEPI